MNRSRNLGFRIVWLSVALLLASCATTPPKQETEPAKSATLLDLEKQLAFAPRDTVLRLRYGRVLWEERDYSEAINQTQRVLKEEPANIEAVRLLAAIQLCDNRPEEARRTLEQAINRAPRDPSLHLLKAYAWKDLEKKEEAVGEFQTVLALEPDTVKAVSAHLGLGAIHEEQENYQAAGEHYRQAVAIYPQLAGLLANWHKETLQPRARYSERMDPLSVSRRRQNVQDFLDQLKKEQEQGK